MRPLSRFLRNLVVLASLAISVAPAMAQKDPTNPFITGPTASTTPTPLTKESKQEVLDSLTEIITKRAFVPGVDLTKWPEFLAQQQEAIDKAETDAAFARAVNAAMRNLGISHIRFSTPRSSQARVRTSTIGVGISARAEEAGLSITSVFPNSPAETAGVKSGETILLVDGKKVDSTEALQGDEGTEVTLHIKGADGVERDVKVKRARYSIVRPDALTWVGDDAAVLRIHSFSKGYDREAIAKMISDASAKAKYLVLDLRSNGGGAIDNLRHLLSLLMPEDTVIGTFISRQTADKYAEAHGGKVETDPAVIAADVKSKYTTTHLQTSPFPGKIAVLVNRGSASASEICAWALREDLSAPVVGTNSMGAVLASVYRRLPSGYEVQYPVSDYVSKGGVRLEKNPIKPDIEVTDNGAEGKDPVVDAALTKLRASN